MIHGLLLLCLIDQFTVSVQEPPAFTVEVHESLFDAAHVESDYYVVMFSASYCEPCRDYKASGKLDAIKKAGYKVAVVDIQENSSFYYGKIPKFWIAKNEQKVHEWSPGTVSPEVILAKIRDLKGDRPKVSTNFFGRKGTSHESRRTLIEHLLSDGIHKGRHTKESLESMSDSELVELHDREHENAGHSVKNGLWKP